MQNGRRGMKNPISTSGRSKTEFIRSYYQTPSEVARRLFYVVLRGGHLRAASDYRIERDHLPGHDLLLCLNGAGFVFSSNRRFRVEQGELAWISGYRPHAHWADEKRPWELYWIRIDGRALEETCNILSVSRTPVFTRLHADDLRKEFENILDLMNQRPLALDALLNASVARIVAALFENRQAETSEGLESLRNFAPEIQNALTKMALYPDRPWRVQELAKLSGMSEAHFYRRFRQATGSSPIDLLRRERINHARRRLLQSNDSVKQIAQQVGYNDAFFFSRDFKRYTGLAPTEYRRQHVQET
jgi:AraC-like DNA-binding protein